MYFLKFFCVRQKSCGGRASLPLSLQGKARTKNPVYGQDSKAVSAGNFEDHNESWTNATTHFAVFWSNFL